ncbi:hypothetical protein WJW27_005455 [Escherichia coli]|uniref:hypothetical protein n=1 Tax=Escherichia coli TaxID=562 RepID=UPI002376DC00|nr:hypothetical protein vBEcoMphAPEC6_01500 [Escherichia phage ph0011]
MAAIRHVGVMRNTGSRVFVVWRSLPDDPEHCLIVYRDSLPEAYVHAVTDIVMGHGQSNIDLWEVMHKIGYLDGRKMLDVLHNMQYLRRVRTCDIDMHTGGNNKISLDVLNKALDENQAKIQEDGKVKDFNPFDPQEADTKVEEATIVEKLISDAQKYEKLAQEYYERAYNLEPSLRPQAQVVEHKKDSKTLYLEIPEGISQTKAIEKVKQLFAARKAK